MRRPTTITPPQGKLGVLTCGMGAVATTFMAGVDLIRNKGAQPVGSVTQLGTIRLGKRTEHRSPPINEFVPLAGLDDLFGLVVRPNQRQITRAIYQAKVERGARSGRN